MLLDDLDRTFDIDSTIDAEEVPAVRLERPQPAKAPEADAPEVASPLPADAPAELVAAAAKLAAAGYRISRDDDHDQPDIPTLSPRELEVLALLAEGAPNKVIARRLDISVHTAKFHVASIIAKLGAVNRTDATAIAMRQGLVQV
ncbi:MAG: helix-turn-helix transcriptional regulator [Rhizobiaceae bacterium]|nr:helix-turn-helix transcriptional regulator [Rhizobiaceae bacterium]